MCFWKACYWTNSKNFTLKHASIVNYMKLKAASWTSVKYSCINSCFSCDRDICSGNGKGCHVSQFFIKSSRGQKLHDRRASKAQVWHWGSKVRSGGKPCTVLYYYNLIILVTIRYWIKWLPESPFLEYTDFFFIYCYYMLSDVEFILCIVACCHVHM